MAVFVMHPVQVVDGVHRVELDLGEVFVTDPVELRGGVRGRRPRHVVRFSRWLSGLYDGCSEFTGPVSEPFLLSEDTTDHSYCLEGDLFQKKKKCRLI